MLNLRLNKVLALVLLFVGVCTGYAQTQHTFPAEDTNNAFTGVNSFSHINSTIYIGAVSGQFSTIQSGVTAACALGVKTVVNIPPASTPADTIGAVTGGCSNTGIVDERTIPFNYYTWNGTVYTLVSSGGGGGGVSLTPSSSQVITNPAYQFAAANDATTINAALYSGSGATAQLTNAIAAAISSGANAVRIPCGTYALTSEVVVSITATYAPPLRIYGDGPCTIFTTNNTGAFHFEGTPGVTLANLLFENMSIVPSVPTTAYNVRVDGLAGFTFRNINMLQASAIGYQFNGSQQGEVDGGMIGIPGAGPAKAFDFEASGGTHSNTIEVHGTQIFVYGASATAFYVNSSDDLEIHGNSIVGNTAGSSPTCTGLYQNTAGNGYVNFHDNHLEGCTQGAYISQARIVNNSFFDRQVAGTTSVEVYGGSGNVIQNNLLQGAVKIDSGSKATIYSGNTAAGSYDTFTNNGFLTLIYGNTGYTNGPSGLGSALEGPFTVTSENASGGDIATFNAYSANIDQGITITGAGTARVYQKFYNSASIWGVNGTPALNIGGLAFGTPWATFNASGLTLPGITGSTTQCLQASSTGVVSGTGSACGSGGGGGAVTSVFGRTGAVVAASGDYTASQVGADPVGAAAAVQTALQGAIQQNAYIYATDTGAANAYAVALSPVPTVVAGSNVLVKVANSSTGASTLAVNGTVTAIRKKTASGIAAIAAGDLVAGQLYRFEYDGTYWQTSGSAAQTSAQIATALNGGTAPTAAQVLIGQVSGNATFQTISGDSTQAANGAMTNVGVYGIKYNGPQAISPAVTPTLNTNQLQYTGEMGAFWENWNMLSMTTGQPDENSANTATLDIPSTSSTTHRMGWVAIWEPSLTATTNIAISFYAKAFGSTQPYVELLIQLSDGSGATLTVWTNVSTCTNISATSGITATATSAGNGYCLIGALYTLPAATFVQQVFLASSTSNSTDIFAGNGTDGAYFSHPMMGVGSSLLTYQDVTSMHRYAAVAYDTNGQTAGVSKWVTPTSYPAVAEVNSITVPCVTGATSYKIFRTGGYTQGALSGTVTCGSAFTDNLTTADGTIAPTGNVINTVSNPVPDQRATQMQSTLVALKYYAPTYPNYSGYVTIGNLEPGLQGTITHIHVTIAEGVTGYPTTLPDTVFLHVLCNGATFNGANDQIISLGGLFYTEDWPTIFAGNYTAVTNATGVYWSANKALEIPFTNGCQLFLGGGLGAEYGSVWAEIDYKVGQYYSSPYRKSWHVQENPLTTITAYSQIPILSTVTSANGGEIENLMLLESSALNYSYMEGNLTGICDGVQCLISNGTEDGFGGGFYYNNGSNSLQTDHWGDWIGGGLQKPLAAYDVLQYRQFGRKGLGDDLVFQNTIQIYDFNGQLGEPGTIGSIQAKTTVTYWLGQ